MEHDTDVVIIGAGIIGCALAFELAHKGYRTINVDKLGAAGFGSTSDSCAIVRAHYSTWDGVAMAFEAFHYWQDWPNYLGQSDERGLARYLNTGTVALKAEGLNWRRVLELYDEVGVEYEEWDEATLRERVPFVSLDSFWPPSRPEDDAFWDPPSGSIAGAIYTPGSGYVNDPALATHNLQAASESKGARFQFNTAVTGILQSNGRVAGVATEAGEISAPIVVNVAGPHSRVINEMAGVTEGMNISTRPLRHEVHLVPAPDGVDPDGIHINDGDNVIYFRSEVGNNLLVGSDDPECDPKDWVEDPDDYDRQVTGAQWRAQVYRLARRIPSLEVPVQPKGIVGLYDVTDDWIPIYDKSNLPGYYMAVGTSGNQFKTAPVAGRLMSEIIDACEHGHDHDHDPVKMSCRYTSAVLDAGFFSRRREINPDSSFSVNG